MGEHGIGHGSDHVLRDVMLVVESELDVQPDEIERSVRQLRAELKDLDIEYVAPGTAENAPQGAKGVDPSSLEVLLVSLTVSGGVFTALIETTRDWLARHATARRISVTIDGDTIVLEKSSVRERDALIDAYIRHHEVE